MEFFINNNILFVVIQYLAIGLPSMFLINKMKESSIDYRQVVSVISLAFITSLVFPYIGIFTTLLFWAALTVLESLFFKDFFASLSVISLVQIFSIIADYVVSLFLDGILDSMNTYLQLGIHVSVTSLIVIGLSILSNYILQKFINFRIINGTMSKLVTILISFSFVVMYIDITYQRMLGEPNSLEKMNAFFFMLYVVVLLVILIMLIVSTKKNFENKLRQEQMINMQNYVDQLELDYQHLRKFRHDYQNILSSIEGYITDSDIEGLSKYYNKYIKKTKQQLKSNLFNLTELTNLKDRVAKSVISSKLTTAQNLGIDSYFECKDIISKFDIDPIDFVRILGILLDNAIEASIDGVLRVAVTKQEKATTIFIGNTYKGELPPLYKLKQTGFSTKGKGRGLGLSNVDEIISNKSNVALETRIDKKMFVQILSIRNGEGE